MVCFKRKPVQYVPLPYIKNDAVEIWVIAETDEVFTDYDSYLRRMDYYRQKKFVCDLTGHSGLTFFEALESERQESEGVDQIFPDPLKEPVLRKVQFSTISRIDHLVDWIYEEFRQDFYPGEHVTAIVNDGDRIPGTVREKARFGETRRPDGTVERPPFTRYFVSLNDRPTDEALVDERHILRDRRSFTKQIIRTFIKDKVTREAWNGAPWLVKDSVAQQLKIDTAVPSHLQHGTKLAERKAQQALKKSGQERTLLNFVLNPPRLPELKPAPKGSNGKPAQQWLAKQKQQQFFAYQQALTANRELVRPVNGLAGATTPLGSGYVTDRTSMESKQQAPTIPTPPPVKYPTEDLEVPPSRDGTHRPALKYLSQKTPSGAEHDAGRYDIEMELVGPLLETWNTLNVFCQVLLLDSFTFDDYLECLHLASETVESELHTEIHCALLKLLVDDQSKGGQVLVQLPELPEEEDSEDDEPSENESARQTSPARKTASDGEKNTSQRRASGKGSAHGSPQPNGTNGKSHRAADMMADYGWDDRLRKRDFKAGGWEMIIVGLLDRLSLKPQLRARCERILEQLAPADLEPTQETARERYATLDINMRTTILQILCMLIVDLKSVRGYIETNNELMTEVRKEKVEWQRARKAAIEELRVLDEQRKLLLPQVSTPPPDPDLEASAGSALTTQPGTEDEDGGNEKESASGTESDATKGRRLRGRHTQGVKRKRNQGKKPEEGQKQGQKQGPPGKISKVKAHFNMVLQKMEKTKAKVRECEQEIAKAEEDLREIECPRTRCLGKDRFWNRYWFLERNAMPWGGLPASSTADAEYANGCVWVQGPDELEYKGFIEISGDEERKYRRMFQMTPLERKTLEEGPTRLYAANQWGYYDQPDSLDMLIGWLDNRGNREVKLRKELQSIRGKIVTHMDKRKGYLDSAKKNAVEPNGKRSSTRAKNQGDQASHRCQRWKNTMALEEIGHLHLDHPPPRKKTRETQAKGNNRQARPLTRQGTRYNF